MQFLISETASRPVIFFLFRKKKTQKGKKYYCIPITSDESTLIQIFGYLESTVKYGLKARWTGLCFIFCPIFFGKIWRKSLFKMSWTFLVDTYNTRNPYVLSTQYITNYMTYISPLSHSFFRSWTKVSQAWSCKIVSILSRPVEETKTSRWIKSYRKRSPMGNQRMDDGRT